MLSNKKLQKLQIHFLTEITKIAMCKRDMTVWKIDLAERIINLS